MASALMESQVFFWLGGFGAMALIAALMVPFRKYYFGQWNPLRASLLAVAIGVGIAVFACWTTTFLSPTGITDKSFVLRWAICALSIMIAFYLALCLITVKKNGMLGYNVSAAILGAVTYSLLLITVVRGNCAASAKAGYIVFAVLYGVLYVAAVVYFAVSPNTEPPVVKDFVIRDTMEKGNGQKVKVVLLCGQSNASGVSRVEYLKKHVSEEDFVRYTSGYKNVMINFFNDNGQNTSGGAFEYLSANAGWTDKEKFYGPELGMADVLSRRFPDETVFIVKYAWGGSNLHTQWLSPSSEGNTGELYKAFVNFTKSCLDYLKKKNYDPKVYAMCWMQGESDAFGTHAEPYGKRSKNLIRDVRAEFSGYASDKGIYFVDAGISDSKFWAEYKKINEQKERNAAETEKYIYLDTIAAGLEYKNEPKEEPDLAHYDSMGMIKLGEMFGDKVAEIME